jgi:hypothetical protein
MLQPARGGCAGCTIEAQKFQRDAALYEKQSERKSASPAPPRLNALNAPPLVCVSCAPGPVDEKLRDGLRDRQ